MKTNWYKWSYEYLFSRFYDLTIKWLLIPFGGEAKTRRTIINPVSFNGYETILEMCCGTGGSTVFIAEKTKDNNKIVAIDLSSEQLKRAKRKKYKCQTDFINGDIMRSPFRDNSFDKVFVSHVIHEMPRENRLKTLQEAKRLLKPNGEVIILEVDVPPSILLRLFIALWCFFVVLIELPTFMDMVKFNPIHELEESGFRDVKKHSSGNGMFQTLIGTK